MTERTSMQKRKDRIIDYLERENLDALLVTNPTNVRYLSGFRGSDASLYLTPKDAMLITDFRYELQAEEEAKGCRVKLINGSFFELVGSLTKALKVKRLGFEYKHLSYGEYDRIKAESSGTAFVSTFDAVERLRQIKDAYEMGLIKKSVSLLKKAVGHFKSVLKPGLTEEDLASETEHFIRSASGERSPFEVIVASAGNCAYPHAKPRRRRIQHNDMVLLDLGVNFDGYNSDLTRMFFLGKITAKAKKIYDIVKGAQERSIRIVRPGVRISSVDRRARDFIAKNGFGKYFGHALGHGVGLEVHEKPHISHKNHAALKPGMVFTIEPAIYLPEWGGIRIEDMISVTKNGHEVLTDDIDK